MRVDDVWDDCVTSLSVSCHEIGVGRSLGVPTSGKSVLGGGRGAVHTVVCGVRMLGKVPKGEGSAHLWKDPK